MTSTVVQASLANGRELIRDDYLDHLERQARSIARRFYERPVGSVDRDDLAAGVEREMMLVLGHLRRLHDGHAQMMHALLEMEAQTRTQLMRIHPSGDLFNPTGHPMHARLEERLHRLDLERVRVKAHAILIEKRRPLHDRLHHLLIRHAVLAI